MANQDKIEIFFVLDTGRSELRYIGARVKPSAGKPEEWCVVDITREIFGVRGRGKRPKPEGLLPLFAWVSLQMPRLTEAEAKEYEFIPEFITKSLATRNRWVREEKRFSDGKEERATNAHTGLYGKMKCFHIWKRFLFATFSRSNTISLSDNSPLAARDIYICDLHQLKSRLRLETDKALLTRLCSVSPEMLGDSLVDEKSLCRAIADFGGLSSIKTSEIRRVLKAMKARGGEFAAQLPPLVSEYIVSIPPDELEELYSHLCKNPFSQRVPLEEVFHPQIAHVRLTPGLRLRIIGRPGAGKSVALYQICRSTPGWHILLIKPSVPQTELEAITSFCKKAAEPVAIVFEDLHRHVGVEGVGLLLYTLTWADAHRPDIAVIVSYRSNEALEVERRIKLEEWHDRGFGDGIWLDPAPPEFIRQVLRLASRTFKVQVPEDVFEDWARCVEERDNTPLCCIQTARELEGTAPSHAFSEGMFVLADKWRILFKDLSAPSGPVESLCPHVLQVLAFLNVVGEPSPFAIETVYSFVKVLFGDIEQLHLMECIRFLDQSKWLLSDGEHLWVHDLQVDTQVVGLFEGWTPTPAFHRLSDATVKLSSHLPVGKAAKMLATLAGVYITRADAGRAEKMADAALALVPNREDALMWRSLARIETQGWKVAADGLRSVIETASRKTEPAAWLLRLFADRRMAKDADQLIRSLRRDLSKSDWQELAVGGYISTGNFDEAVAAAEAHVGSNLASPSAAVHFLLMDTYLETGRAGEALKVADYLLGLAPDNALIWVARAEAYFFLRKYREAKKACDEAIRLAPNYFKIRCRAAEIEFLEASLTDGRVSPEVASRALKHLRWCLNVIPWHHEALALKGLALAVLGQTDGAKENLWLALRSKTGLPLRLRIVTEKALSYLGDQKALSSFQSTVEGVALLDPIECLRYCGLAGEKVKSPGWFEAFTLIRLKRVEEAAEVLRKTFTCDPDKGDYSMYAEHFCELKAVLSEMILPIEAFRHDRDVSRADTRLLANETRSETDKILQDLLLEQVRVVGQIEVESAKLLHPPVAPIIEANLDAIDNTATLCILTADENENSALACELHSSWMRWCWKQGRKFVLGGVLPTIVVESLKDGLSPPAYARFTLGVACIQLAFHNADIDQRQALRHLISLDWRGEMAAARSGDPGACVLVFLVDQAARAWGEKSPATRKSLTRGRSLLRSGSYDEPASFCVLSDGWQRLSAYRAAESGNFPGSSRA